MGLEDLVHKVRTSIDDLVTDEALLDVYGDRDVVRAPKPVADETVEKETPDADENPSETSTASDPASDYADDPYNFDDADDMNGEGKAAVSAPPTAAAFDDLEAVSAAQEESWPVADAPETNRSVDMLRNQQSEKAIALSAKIEALETAISSISDTFEPDDAGEGDYAGTEPEAMAWEDESTDDDEPTRPQFSHSAAVFSSRKRVAERERADSVDVAPKAAEAAPVDAPRDLHVEEAEVTKIIPDRTPPTAEPAQESVAHLSKAAPAETPDPDTSGVTFEDEPQTIDEDALRDLISDIVREELQGALGERITRNVRKLVRREIHRALTAQDLE